MENNQKVQESLLDAARVMDFAELEREMDSERILGQLRSSIPAAPTPCSRTAQL